MEDAMEPFNSSPYLNQDAAGAFLGLSVRTLERFRVDGRGPRYLKLGRRVAYTREDLMSWAESRRRSSTADPGGRIARSTASQACRTR
jgi:predicted DNA-binding transcriptional regulator AlpA